MQRVLKSTYPACSEENPLVNGATPIPDSYMTASSEISPASAPYRARLHNQPGSGYNGAWCNTVADAATTASYIQVILFSNHLLGPTEGQANQLSVVI